MTEIIALATVVALSFAAIALVMRALALDATQARRVRYIERHRLPIMDAASKSAQKALVIELATDRLSGGARGEGRSGYRRTA
jgi:hypothetical protein